jgi:CBS domain-containing protein
MQQRNPHTNWPTIEQILDRAPLQIAPDSSVLEAISLMSRGKEGSCVLVVEGQKRDKKPPTKIVRGNRVGFCKPKILFSYSDYENHSSTASSFVLVLREGVSRSKFI